LKNRLAESRKRFGGEETNPFYPLVRLIRMALVL
jgi:hypothetical protein